MKKRYSIEQARIRQGYIFLLPAGIVLVGFLLIPLLYSLYLSFHDWNLIYDVGGPKFNGINNFVEILRNKTHLYSIGITLLFVAVSVSFEIVIGFFIALLFNGSSRSMRLIRTFIVFPMMISEVVAALIFRYILNSDFGLVNYLLGLVNISVDSWTSVKMAFPTIAMLEVWQQTPFAMLIILAGLQNIPQEIIEASSVDGASWLRRLIHITIPCVKPQILVALVFRTMFCMRVFTQPWVLTGGGPANKTMVIGIDIYQQAFRYFEFGKANTLSWILVAITVIFVAVYVRMLGKNNME